MVCLLQLSFVSQSSTIATLKKELKKAMKFGFSVVFDARQDHGEEAQQMFDQVCFVLTQLVV